jgi:hypothetical protein
LLAVAGGWVPACAGTTGERGSVESYVENSDLEGFFVTYRLK